MQDPTQGAAYNQSLPPSSAPSPPTAPLAPATSPQTTITAIIISVFLMGAGMGLQGSAVSLRASLEGFSDSMIGIIMSFNYIGLIVGSLFAPPLIRSVGYVRAFAASASLGSASAIAHLLWIAPFPWLVFRSVTGFSLSIMFVVAESWLNASSKSHNRGRLLSLYSIVYIVSMGAGQPLMEFFPPAGFEIFAITTILISFCLIPVAIMRVSGEPGADQAPPRLLQTFARSPLAGSGIFVGGLIAGATWSLTPLYGQQIALDSGTIGVLMLVLSLGSMAFQMPLGWISDALNRRYAILWAVVGAACTGATIILLEPSGIWLFLCVFLFGGFAMPLYSLSVALAMDRVEPHEMVRVAGAIIIFFGLGNAIGPVFASQFMHWMGPQGLFFSMTLVLAFLALFVLVRKAISPRLPKRKARYRVYPRTTPSAFKMLPKARMHRHKKHANPRS